MSDLGSALDLLAVDPGLGACVRAGPGPVRDRFLAGLRAALPEGTPWHRMPAAIDDIALLGGIDLAATLAAGRPIAEKGLLARAAGGIVVAAMAERLPPGTAARIAQALDAGGGLGIVALDEGLDAEERPPAALRDRLALHLDLAAVPPKDAADLGAEDKAWDSARARLAAVTTPPEVIEALAGASLALGIHSLRAPLLALRAARAAAALAGNEAPGEAELALAARLVLAPRATVIPAPAEDPAEPPPPNPETGESEGEGDNTGRLADQVLDAARAALPPGLLTAMAAGALRTRESGPTGARQKDAKRGRPVGTRRGDPRAGARLAILDTLRAAAPWQRLRGATAGRVQVRRDDFRVRRFAARTRTTTVFVVDASGSAALHRLAEAKGAVELLLADCYVRRDRVAMLAMRGEGAELLLPPTASLARAKRSLAALPGGGGTPLAAGIEAAAALADQVRRGGQTPLAVFLTDGRANIALDGTPGRARAEQDAETAAARLRGLGCPALLVDIGQSAHPFARRIAERMGARYLQLPRADSGALARAVAAG